jgi:hypothetical protein
LSWALVSSAGRCGSDVSTATSSSVGEVNIGEQTYFNNEVVCWLDERRLAG